MEGACRSWKPEPRTADLNSMEKSFSDHFKWFEKQKEEVQSYHTRKNE